jgi:hypothetical protein
VQQGPRKSSGLRARKPGVHSHLRQQAHERIPRTGGTARHEPRLFLHENGIRDNTLHHADSPYLAKLGKDFVQCLNPGLLSSRQSNLGAKIGSNSCILPFTERPLGMM